MKQSIDLAEEKIHPTLERFILLWKQKKGYSTDATLTLGQVMELIIAVTPNYYRDWSDGRFFNNILINNESVVAWDGTELIDTLFFEAQEGIKHLIARSGTFNEELPS